MPKAEKVERVGQLKERIEGSHALLLTEYRGLTVSDITELRRSLAEDGASFAVLPQPQRVTLNASDFRFGPAWGLALKGVASGDNAVISFNEGLRSRFQLPPLASRQAVGTVTLALSPGAVAIGDAREQVRGWIGDERSHGRHVAPKRVQALVPGGGIRRRVRRGPVAGRPVEGYMLGIAREFEDVPLGDSHMF